MCACVRACVCTLSRCLCFTQPISIASSPIYHTQPETHNSYCVIGNELCILVFNTDWLRTLLEKEGVSNVFIPCKINWLQSIFNCSEFQILFDWNRQAESNNVFCTIIAKSFKQMHFDEPMSHKFPCIGHITSTVGLKIKTILTLFTYFMQLALNASGWCAFVITFEMQNCCALVQLIWMIIIRINIKPLEWKSRCRPKVGKILCACCATWSWTYTHTQTHAYIAIHKYTQTLFVCWCVRAYAHTQRVTFVYAVFIVFYIVHRCFWSKTVFASFTSFTRSYVWCVFLSLGFINFFVSVYTK